MKQEKLSFEEEKVDSLKKNDPEKSSIDNIPMPLDFN